MMHDADLEYSLMKKKNRCSYVLLPIFSSDIPDLALEILKMLICVCFHDILQFVPGMIWH